MMRTMWGWIGFKSIGVEHARAPRHGGKSTYAFFRNVRFALNGIIASSVAPLKLIPLFGIGTLLFDLLTPEEESVDRHTAHLRFDIAFLAARLVTATLWARKHCAGPGALSIGYFGASTGAAAALVAAASLREQVDTVESHAPPVNLVPGLAHQDV